MDILEKINEDTQNAKMCYDYVINKEIYNKKYTESSEKQKIRYKIRAYSKWINKIVDKPSVKSVLFQGNEEERRTMIDIINALYLLILNDVVNSS